MNRAEAIDHLTELAQAFVLCDLATDEDGRVACTCDTTDALRALGVDDEEMS